MISPQFRILFLTPQVPYPPRQGTSIRNFNLIRYLADRHGVDLVSFSAPGDDLAPDSPLHGLCRRIDLVPQPVRSLSERLVSTLTSAQPDMALRLASDEMFQVCDRAVLEDYDVIQIEGIEMAPYGLHLMQKTLVRKRRPAVVFDDHNCEYLLQKRNAFSDFRRPSRWLPAAYSLAQWQKLQLYEKKVCGLADLVLAVSEPDRVALERLRFETPTLVVPNGIDTLGYHDLFGAGVGRANIVFTGKMDYRPNIEAALWFGSEVFPQILETRPDARFQIVGQQPHTRLDVLRGNDRIEITGEVPDIRPYLRQASVFVIPMRVGGGTRLKALEAMAGCLPIVATPQGIEGIDVTGGRELLIAETPEAFAQAVLVLLQDQEQGAELSRSLGVAARELVVGRYDWEQIVPVLGQSYAGLVSGIMAA